MTAHGIFKSWEHQYGCVRLCMLQSRQVVWLRGVNLSGENLLGSSSLSAFVFVSLNISSFFVGMPLLVLSPLVFSFTLFSPLGSVCLPFSSVFLFFGHCASSFVCLFFFFFFFWTFYAPWVYKPPLPFEVWDSALIITLQKACGKNSQGKGKRSKGEIINLDLSYRFWTNDHISGIGKNLKYGSGRKW